VIGKVLNQRAVLRRALRDHGDTLAEPDRGPLDRAADQLDRVLTGLGKTMPLDQVRGMEGEGTLTVASSSGGCEDRSVVQLREL
jgi:CRISPR-associated protein Cas1